MSDIDMDYVCETGHLKVQDAQEVHVALLKIYGITDPAEIEAEWNRRSDEPWDSPIPGSYVAELTDLLFAFMKDKAKAARHMRN